MSKIRLDFRSFLQPGAATVDTRTNERLLNELRAAHAVNVQLTRGAMEKLPGSMRLVGLTGTGYAMTGARAPAAGCYFPDHADYDLGKTWTIDVVYKPASLPGAGVRDPIYWRADTSNDEVTTLEIDENGYFQFTHLDSNGTEKTLTSAGAASATTTYYVRVVRFFNELRMFVDGRHSATRTDLDASYTTAATSTSWWVLCNTQTDGDTVDAGAAGTVDEFRVWIDEVDDKAMWGWTEYPWPSDPRLVLYARFNETTGDVTDYSTNGNDGTVQGSPTRDASSLVTVISPILKLFFLRTSAGKEQHCVWSGGGFYAVDVQ